MYGMRNKNITLLSGSKNMHTYFLRSLQFKTIILKDFGKVCVVCVQLSHLPENAVTTILLQGTQTFLLSISMDED